MQGRYIRASELNSFAFCERAWHLEQKGAQSTLQKERAQGTEDHEKQNEILHRASTNERLATVLAVLACVGMVLALLIWVLMR